MTEQRREALVAAATDYALSAGLIGLSLRPVAAAVGTSDRMLIYHFGSRDALVSAITTESCSRAVAAIDALPPAPTVRAGVRALWAAYQRPELSPLMKLYCQAAATGLIGREPYRSDVRASNETWSAALGRYLIRCGADPQRAPRVVRLIDSALYGFFLDLVTDRPEELQRGVDDLADAAQAVATRPA
ncbi:MAG: TetR/AcrR family transcriptional regulator [Marmoricola sp.]